MTTLKSYFQLYSALPQDQIERWAPLLVSAAQQLLPLLKKEVAIDKEMNRLCSSAAGLAYSDYLLVSGSEDHNVEQIKVGDISLKSGSGSKRANVDYGPLRAYFYAQISDLIQVGVGIFPHLWKGERMIRKYTKAIEGVGCWFTTQQKDEKVSFLASLQPAFPQGRHLEGDTGYGVEGSFRLYLPYNHGTAQLKEGAVISRQNSRYRILRMETVTYSDAPLYRQGTCLRIGGDES